MQCSAECNFNCVPQVLGSLTPANLQAAARRLLPYPCRSRYTSITMVPRPPGLLQRLLFKLATLQGGSQMAVGGIAAAAVLAAGGLLARAWYRR